MSQSMDFPSALIHGFSCSMFQKNTQGIYTWASDALLNRQKLSAKDLIGKKDSDLPWSAYSQKLRTNDEEVLDLREPKAYKELVSRGGQAVYGICHKSPFYDSTGQLVGVLGIFIDLPAQGPNLRVSSTPQLSVREKQCLKNLSQGMTAAESARALCLSKRTVEGYLEQLRLKLACKNQSELLAFYYRHN